VPTETPPPHATRRRLLASITTGILTAIGGVLGLLGGGAIVSSTVRRQEAWLAASALHELPDNEPTAVTLTVRRLDGYREAIQRQTIFLVKTGESAVTAFDARCTHLGCLVGWDAQEQVFRCPCHGGVFDRTGAVVDGPPPGGLVPIATRVDGDRVMVQA